MVINEQTKVSEVIEANKDSIDAIAAIAKPLKKLKNPLLRKVMARRVTLKEAAKIGGVPFEDFVKALAPLGFTYEKSEPLEQEREEPIPDWLQALPQEKINRFDVRKILENGEDPLKAIMTEFKKVPLGEALCIIVNFEPIPLITRLGRKNIKTFTKHTEAEVFETYFYKSPEEEASGVEPVTAGAGKIVKDSEADFEAICNKFPKELTKVIDVKDLQMPAPRMTILEELGDLSAGHALYVYHKRVPIFLLEDLADMEFEVHIWEIENERDVRLLLFKSN